MTQYVYDRRRIVRTAHMFQTRKSGKTAFGAALDFMDFMYGDTNGQVLICANSQSQSKIAFAAVKAYARQVDPRGKYMRITANEIEWRPGYGRSNKVLAMSAGGKTKDGLFGSLVHSDEMGSASYVKDKSDMKNLVDVCVGSMGPRRQPLHIITTTAGRVMEGPYQGMLRNVEASLVEELNVTLDGQPHPLENDDTFAILFEVDQWRISDNLDDMDDENLFAMVNSSIGTTVQPTYYHNRLKDARMSTDTMREVLTKDFNIWQTDRVRTWINADEIRKLQVDYTMRGLDKREWVAFAGADFSKVDDMTAIGWLCINQRTKRVFWDCDAFIAEQQIDNSPNAALYRQWAEDGWLHVCRGGVINPQDVVAAISEADRHVNICAIGYDAYDSMEFVNHIQGWMASKLSKKFYGRQLDAAIKQRLMPVPQTFASYNSAVQVVWQEVHQNEQKVFVSPNPIIPWVFGNCMLQESPDGENVKIVKSGANNKVDVAQTICTCYIMLGRLSSI